jgi:hypothetical protein
MKKKNELVKALRAAIDKFNPLVAATLESAGPEYKKLRAQEAFIAGDIEFAAVLVVWSLADEQAVSTHTPRCDREQPATEGDAIPRTARVGS